MTRFHWVSIAIVVFPLAIVAPTWAEENEPDAAQAQEATEKQDDGAGYRIGSVLLTSANIPLRGVLCVGSTIVAGGLYVITLGTAVNATVYMVKEACGGPWIITPEMMKGKPKRSD